MRMPNYRLAPLNWIQWLTLMLVLALSTITPILFHETAQDRRASTEAIVRADQSLRTFICFFDATVDKQPHQTAAQREAATKFFDAALKKIHQPRCSN